MSDPRPGRRFDQPTASDERTDDDATLRGAHAYLPEQASTPAPEEEMPSPALDAALAPPRKRRWGLLVLLTASLGLGTLEAGQTLYHATLGGDWLAGAWSALGLLAIGLGGKALLGELWRLRKLRRHARLRERLDDTWPASGEGAQENVEPLALAEALRTQMGIAQGHPHWQSFIAAHEAHHSAAETRELLAWHLLRPRDQAARRLITRMSGETAVMVAVSPLTLVDMALMAWRNIAMLDRIAALYGLQLGYASRLRLFREVLRNMAFAGASEMVTDAGMDLLSMNLAAKLSTRAGQGLGAGLLTARLGLRAIATTRPIAFTADERPRLADLRREVWQQLRRLDDSAQSGRQPS